MKTQIGMGFIKRAIYMTCIGLVFWSNAQVKVWEEEIVIPTLKVGTPAPHPTFKAEINMRGDEDRIYPYLYNSRITTEYEDKTYLGCFLENEFIKVLVTPELGGKLYGAVDKTNDYKFFYWQPTVKPALISLTGPWVSGGIEWCFPSGHRQTGYQKIGHKLVENADGSKTIWVGETEWVHGLRWLVGLTVYPGKSLLEAKVRLINPTHLPQSQYMWAVAATHADSSYQLIYPTELMTTHNRSSYSNWPVHNGRDNAWWKNIPNANSYFAVDLEGFFGGYDHGKNAGTAFVGNKHIVIGKKFWTWGSSPSGRLWDWVLSDGGGPYVEPQAGAYTDNQPDFHWLNPGEVRDYSQFFFPVSEIGAFKKANIEGALNLEFNANEIELGVYSTSRKEKGKVVLKYKGAQVFEKQISPDPSTPFTASLPDYRGEKTDYQLLFLDSASNVLISYSPDQKREVEVPEGENPIQDPSNYSSSDERWNLGEYLYRNRDKIRAEEFFRTILKEDSLDTRANRSMAQLYIEKSNYRQALMHLERAQMRNRDLGGLYYLRGVANNYLEDYQSAYDAFYRSTHYQEYFSMGYEQVARIDLFRGEFGLALEHIERALERNIKSPCLWVLKAVTLRLNGQDDQAKSSLDKALSYDPMNFWAINEQIRGLKKTGQPAKSSKAELRSLLLDDPHYYIELALDYLELGMYNDALQVYRLFEDNVGENALVEYYKGYCLDKLRETDLAVQAFSKAKEASIINVFPFREKTLEILDVGLTYDSLDANAYYYKGLIYAGLLNGSKSYQSFIRASKLNPTDSKIWRNLGLLKHGYPGVYQDLKLARTYYKEAFDLAKKDDLILMEFDKVKMELQEDPFQRLKFLKKHDDVVEKNDDLLATMLDLMVNYGEFETPIKYFETHIFNNREGKYGVHNSYMNAYIGLAKKAQDSHKAIEYYKKAAAYPDNLKVKPREPNLRGFLYYPMAILYEEIGDMEEMERLLKITAKEHTQLPTIANYYQALALQKLDPDDHNSLQLMKALKEEGENLIEGRAEGYLGKPEQLLVALGHYYLSLFHQFLDNNQESDREIEKARKLLLTIEQEAIKLAQKEFS